jgi:DNA-binding GntR family transcriptional regulator
MKTHQTELARQLVARRMAQQLCANLPDDSLKAVETAKLELEHARRKLDETVWETVKLAFDTNGRNYR